MERTQKKLRICTFLLVLNIGIIWGNSLLPGSVSGAISGFVRDVLAALFGGVMTGAGIGMILARMATTGGTDLFSALIHEKLKHFTIRLP